MIIDFHTHVYTGGSDLGVNPHTTLTPQGVTMAVDAGTAGTGRSTWCSGDGAEPPALLPGASACQAWYFA